MRDILKDLDAGKYLSDPDPVRRAQIQMRTPLPKRFYDKACVVPRDDGTHAVHLDDRPVRTPGRALLALPTEASARLVADEFEAQREVIDPATMPVLRLVNTALDGVAATADAVREDVAKFSGSDMLCYRADGPPDLIAREAEAWDPWIEWARSRIGARFFLAEGVMHVRQAPETIAAVERHLAGCTDPFRLAALHLMTTLTGSAVIAMAVEAGDLDAEEAWRIAHVDEDWNIAQWGADEEASVRRTLRKRDMMAAAALLKALA